MSSGILTNHTTQNASGSIDASISIGEPLYVDELILTTIRVEMASSTVALAQRILYIDVPFLNASNLYDGVSEFSRLPILLQDMACTVYCPNLKVSLHSEIPASYKLRVYNRDGTLATNMVSITLQFNYFTG